MNEKFNDKVELFVPGRVCLVGELSDLVSEYLGEHNPELIPGEAIAVGINKGIYATVEKSDRLVFKMEAKNLNIAMDIGQIAKITRGNEFFSYVCGTTEYMMKNYNVGGIQIVVDKMDLPIQKGLSSSAAVCVLVARAFNILYDLNLPVEEEMKIAYEGEHLTGSGCGRLDQICATGKKLSHIIFYKDYAKYTKVKVQKKIYLVIADLKAKKDTKKILSSLRRGIENPTNEDEYKARVLVGEENKKMVEESIRAIEAGDLKRLGEMFIVAQKLIDDTSNICDELIAPILHRTLNDPYIQSLTYGGKGIGSNGEGSVQFVSKDKDSQQLLIDYLNNVLCMDAFEFNIEPTN